MARYSAFLDECILVPIALADTLLRLAEAKLYRSVVERSRLDETVAAIEVVHPGWAGPFRERPPERDDLAKSRGDAVANGAGQTVIS
jgi:hypothetical protein